MSLSAGSRLGLYEIVAPLGAGGMGEVYRARDTKLGRAVAVKVLPDAFTSDPERVPRFEREAKVLASLNHPNIAALFGMDQDGERHFLVMELVEGETLAERLERGRLPVDEALRIALQMADALETAHEQGIVHRDLKPANVKITPDDKVKVLDFGLAKAMDTAPAAANMTHSPTLSMMATGAGIILGTAAYMSPEQAKGAPADQRSDIFSFGTVLYEMLTGRQPFKGDTAPEVMANVLVRDVDLSTLAPDLNPRLRDLLARCLQKQPKKRWQAIGDLRAELEQIAARPHAPAPAAVTFAAPRPLWKRMLPVAIAVVVTATTASIVTWRAKPVRPAPIIRFPITLDENARFGFTTRQAIAISPDGTRIVYVVPTGASRSALMLRSLDDPAPRPIPGTSNLGVVLSPVFSPDGEWVAFWSGQDGTLKKIAVAGGAPVTLCKTASPWGMSWDADAIVFGEGTSGVLRVSASGGDPEVVARVALPEVAYGPQLINRGQAVLFSVASGQDAGRWDQAQIVVQRLGSTERTTLIRGGSDARYVPTGHLVYAVAGVLLAVPFDAATTTVLGGPVPVVEGVARSTAPGTSTGVAHFAFSDAGVLAYLPGTASTAAAQLTPALLDLGAGTLQPLAVPARNYASPRFSPDGKRLVLTAEDGKETQVWVYDGNAGPPRRLTFGGDNTSPIWTPDGRAITFQSNRDGDRGVYQQPADGSGTAQRLTKADAGVSHFPEAWSPDGKTLVYRVATTESNALWTMSTSGDMTPKLFAPVEKGKAQFTAAFSPDGRWLAYGSNELALNSYFVFVQPFPPTGAKYQITTTLTSAPVWSRDGKRLYVSFADRISAVDIRTSPDVSFGAPVAIRSEGTLPSTPSVRNYDVSPDSKRMLVIASSTVMENIATRRAMTQLNVVVNWFEDLKAKAPVK